MGARIGVLFLLMAAAVSCGGPTVDLSKGLEVLDVSSGWLDAGIVEGQNKLVPSISFKLKNVSDQTLPVLQANVLFRRVAETEEWGSAFLTVTGSEGLAPGQTSNMITATSQQGYTGAEPRQDMLNNTHFVDAKSEIFGKYASVQWKKLGDYPIRRQLIER
jgi:hypothetical protein